MAIRSEDLVGADAVVYRFPIEVAPRRRARRRAAARRRRTLSVATVLMVVGAVLLAGGPEGSVRATEGRYTPRAVVVQAGDTLWGLAERFAPDGLDVRIWVDATIALNELEGPLQAGSRLRLPRL